MNHDQPLVRGTQRNAWQLRWNGAVCARLLCRYFQKAHEKCLSELRNGTQAGDRFPSFNSLHLQRRAEARTCLAAHPQTCKNGGLLTDLPCLKQVLAFKHRLAGLSSVSILLASCPPDATYMSFSPQMSTLKPSGLSLKPLSNQLRKRLLVLVSPQSQQIRIYQNFPFASHKTPF